MKGLSIEKAFNLLADTINSVEMMDDEGEMAMMFNDFETRELRICMNDLRQAIVESKIAKAKNLRWEMVEDDDLGKSHWDDDQPID